MRRVRNGMKIRRQKKNATSITMLVSKHASSGTTPDHIPCSSFLAPLATLSAHTRQRSTSCWMPVTLRPMTTTTTSSSNNNINRRNKMKVYRLLQGRQRRAVCRHLPTCQVCLMAARTGVSLVAYRVDILGFVPVVPRLWQQWTIQMALRVFSWLYHCQLLTIGSFAFEHSVYFEYFEQYCLKCSTLK